VDPCMGACCIVEQKSNDTWTYVGEGKGSYSKANSYSFVGAGGGAFEKEELTKDSGWQFRNCCVGLSSLFALSVCVYLIGTLPCGPLPPLSGSNISSAIRRSSRESSNSNASTIVLATPPLVARPAKATTSGFPYDCNVGYDEWPLQWVKGWAGAKKLYCCRVAHKGCPSELPAPSGTPGIPRSELKQPPPDDGPYDCAAGYHPCYTCLLKHWSRMKLNWCCERKKIGCKANTPMNM